MAQIINIRKTKFYKERVQKPESDFEYHSLYRFKKENVKWLADHFLGNREERRGGALTSVQRMEVLLANLGFMTGISKEMGIHRTTVSKPIKDTLIMIAEKAEQWIVFPNTKKEINRAKIRWAETRDFLCKIDCTLLHLETNL